MVKAVHHNYEPPFFITQYHFKSYNIAKPIHLQDESAFVFTNP